MKNKKSILVFAPLTILSPIVFSSAIEAQTVPYTDLNDTHAYYYSSTKLNFNDWMSAVPGWKKLGDLNIPGTHDSGMFSGHGIAYAFGKAYAKTQSLNWAQQLKQGIRFFDIRVNEEMWIKHGATWSYYENLSTFLNAMVDFLKQHPRETVIFRVKDEDISSPSSPNLDFVRKMRERFENTLSDPKYQPYMFKNTKKVIGLNPTLDELRGKIFVYNHMHHNISTDIRFGTLWNNANNKTIQQDFYNSTEQQKFNAVKGLIELAQEKQNGDTIFMNFVSRANGETIWNTSSPMNKKMLEYLNTEAKNYNKLGVLIFDYPGDSLVHRVIKTNYYISDEEISRGVLGKNNTSFQISNIYDYTDKINLSSNFNNNTYIDLYIDNVAKLKRYKLPANTNSITVPDSQKLVYGQKVRIDSYKLVEDNIYYPERKFNMISSERVVEPHPPYISLIEGTKSKILAELGNVINSSIKTRIQELIEQLYLSKLDNLYSTKKASDANIQLVNKIASEYLEMFGKMNEVSTLVNKYDNLKTKLNGLTNVFDNSIKKQIDANVAKIWTNINSIIDNSFDLTRSNTSIDSLTKELDFNGGIFNIFSNLNSNWINLDSTFETSKTLAWLDTSKLMSTLKSEQQEIINQFNSSLHSKNYSNLETDVFAKNNKIKTHINHFNNVISVYDTNKVNKLYQNQIKLINNLFNEYVNNSNLDSNVLSNKLNDLSTQKTQILEVLNKYELLISENWYIWVNQALKSQLTTDHTNLISLFENNYSNNNAIDISYISEKIANLNNTINLIFEQNVTFEDYKTRALEDLKLSDQIIKYIKNDYLSKLQNAKAINEINSLIVEYNKVNNEKLSLLKNYNLTGQKASDLIKNDLLNSNSEAELNEILANKAQKMQELIIQLNALPQKWLKVLGLKQYDNIIIDPYNVPAAIKSTYADSINLVNESIRNISDIYENEKLSEIINKYNDSEDDFVKYDYFSKQLDGLKQNLNTSNISAIQKREYLTNSNTISYIYDLVALENEFNTSKAKVEKFNGIRVYKEASELQTKILNLKDQISNDSGYDEFYSNTLVPLNDAISRLKDLINTATNAKTSWNYKNSDLSLKNNLDTNLQNSPTLLNELDYKLINKQSDLLRTSVQNLNGDIRFNKILNEFLSIIHNQKILNVSVSDEIYAKTLKINDINELESYKSSIEKIINNLIELKKVKDTSYKILSEYNYIDSDESIKNEYSKNVQNINSILTSQNSLDKVDFNIVIQQYNNSYGKLNGTAKLVVFKAEKSKSLTDETIPTFSRIISEYKLELNSDEINNLASANDKWNQIETKVNVLKNIDNILSEFNSNYNITEFKNNFVVSVTTKQDINELNETAEKLKSTKLAFNELIKEIEYDSEFVNTEEFTKLTENELAKYKETLSVSKKYIGTYFDLENLNLHINNLRNSRIHNIQVIPLIPLQPSRPIVNNKPTILQFVYKSVDEQTNQEVELFVGDAVEISDKDFDNFKYEEFVPQGFVVVSPVSLVKGQKNIVYISLIFENNKPVQPEGPSVTDPVEPEKPKEPEITEPSEPVLPNQPEEPSVTEPSQPVLPDQPEQPNNTNKLPEANSSSKLKIIVAAVSTLVALTLGSIFIYLGVKKKIFIKLFKK
ncbi:hypothetical protein MADP07_00462 [Mycoplasma anatis]|uniref:Phosphatidylinositol-specific phospholipase C X domain-containing protein n=1 Tax=Mycoplasmopsis anatis TaxID=171279 RepID=A0A9Q3QDE5_9BACT|nr:hypothetical protein [Mycoplasmopsis anatis]MBW0597615.1 hypothetical protein [Mycoplasmopsis anatis]MBW0602731.1 hypothetical protein [Mycoplasmopsis anatis]MBW0604331.1 hypothetical protein [Mycoplasmopsis anatis]